MLRQRTVLFILTAFLFLFGVSFSNSAHAADPDWKNKDCSALNLALQQAETSHAQDLAQNTTNFYAYMPPIDLATYNCLKQIDDAMNMLQGVSNLGLGVILDGIITTAITNIIGQACTYVMGTINNIEQLVYSQINRFCLPLPNLNLGLTPPSFGAGPTCSGTPLLKLTPLSSAPTTGPSLWQIWKLDTTGKMPSTTGPTQ